MLLALTAGCAVDTGSDKGGADDAPTSDAVEGYPSLEEQATEVLAARGTAVAVADATAAASTDVSRNGPYGSTVLRNQGPSGRFTLYVPRTLGAQGMKHPIVAWMSGGGTSHELYPLLPRLATHGFVVVAPNVIPGIGSEIDLGKQLLAGIDWTIAEGARSGSQLSGKLDTTKVASMGYSMGSLATFTIAADPRLTTTFHISGGNFEPARIANLRQPAAFVCGKPGGATCNILSGDCDIAAANCDVDFKNATTPVYYANFQGGHLGFLLPPTEGRIGTLATAWMRWKLMGDSSMASMFTGPDCTTCRDPNWKVQRKGL